MVARYPQPVPAWINADAASDMALMKTVISGARSLARIIISIRRTKSIFITAARILQCLLCSISKQMTFCTLAKANFLKPEPSEGAPKGCCVKVVSDTIALLVNLTGIIDIDKEIARLTKDLERLNPVIENIKKKMDAPGYTEKVPEAVRIQSAEKLQATKLELSTVQKAIDDFKAML